MSVSESERQATVTPASPVRTPAKPASARKRQPELRKRKRRSLAVYQSCKSAMQALRAKKMRSLLTSLGIIIGVAAVIMVISIGESNAAAITKRLSTLNPNELVIRSGSASSGGVRQGAGSSQSLTRADADA